MGNYTPNDGVHISYIVSTTSCAKHGADKGDPCWTVYHNSTERSYDSVCGSRIKKAGFSGKIDPTSLRRGQKFAAK